MEFVTVPALLSRGKTGMLGKKEVGPMAEKRTLLIPSLLDDWFPLLRCAFASEHGSLCC